jgi:hypothetical protein
MDQCCQRTYDVLPRIVSHSEAVFWLQCLSHQPHDPALAPSVEPSISIIPPVNASGSYYDGMNLPILCVFLWWVTDDSMLFFFHRSGVHSHGPEYSG